MRVVPLGDSALLVRVRETIEPAEETLAAVLQTLEILRAANLPGVLELVPAFVSVGVYFDAAQLSLAGETKPPSDRLTQAIEDLLGKRAARKAVQVPARTMEIPVCYEDEFAPDLGEVARRSGLTKAEVIARHGAAHYRVHCLGFTPGFPYLSGLPPELATPRRATPRAKVPAGSVGIGGAQAGIYPSESPGGWNIIGRTARRLFDPTQARPVLLSTGDYVRFRAISREEYESTR